LVPGRVLMRVVYLAARLAFLGACVSGGPRPPSSAEDVEIVLDDLRGLVLQQVMVQHPTPSSEAFCLGLGGTFRTPIELPSEDLLSRFENSSLSVFPLDACGVTGDGHVTTKHGNPAQAILITSLVLRPGNRAADARIQAGLPLRGEYTCQASLGDDGWRIDGCVPMAAVVR
jgi:hypothetical protein